MRTRRGCGLFGHRSEHPIQFVGLALLAVEVARSGQVTHDAARERPSLVVVAIIERHHVEHIRDLGVGRTVPRVQGGEPENPVLGFHVEDVGTATMEPALRSSPLLG